MEKRKNKSDGERTYPMMGRVPSRTLQVGRRREEIAGELFGSLPTGREKNKQWSESIFGVTPYTTEPGTLDMSHGWIRHVRWFET
jgi:hypothetical protein